MSLLERVDAPSDIRAMTVAELTELSSEIRAFLLDNVAETGGHLASGLGVVELTVALHYCLNTPDDKIVWDVGHQCYPHKILTGRRNEFGSLRRLGGLSGFPRPSESEYDAFVAGHASTAISAAVGMAAARDLAGETRHIAAVIGDGSMTGGLAYEGMNNAGALGSKLLVVLNDNEMSIDRNVGALSVTLAKYVSRARMSNAYLDVKRGVKSFLSKAPFGAGNRVERLLGRFRDALKGMIVPGRLFEELGFTYIGPVDGHDVGGLIKNINDCLRLSRPVLLHVRTVKGKGYPPAEKAPEHYHGVGRFDVKTGLADGGNGKPLTDEDNGGASSSESLGESFGAAFGRALVRLGGANEDIVAVTAAMAAGTCLAGFAERFPKRCFDVGIAESHAVTFCAGLAKAGKRPVFAVYSSFLQRSYDQIINDVCVDNLPVVFAIDRAGLTGEDGETHQGAFDMAFLGHMPNMTILAPRDGDELGRMLEYAVSLNAPAAIRYPKGDTKGDAKGDAKTAVGVNRKAEPLVSGEFDEFGDTEQPEAADGVIVSVGAAFGAAAAARLGLKDAGINVSVIDAKFVKPISAGLVGRLRRYKNIFTVEDGVASGGFGERLNGSGVNVRKSFALPDRFVEHGRREELLSLCGLDAESIVAGISHFVLT